MLEVSKYIKDLLFIHDCVILPGFGGFVANYKPANIDDECKLGIPPSKSIGFNRNLSQNDGLLINRLSESENLTYAESEKSIQFFIEDLRVRIQRGEKVSLDKIGCFYNDKRHNLLFEPSSELNYLADAFGLERFSLPTLSTVSDEKNHPVVMPLFTRKRLWYAAAAIPFILSVALLPMNSERRASEASILSIEKNANKQFVQLESVVSPPEDLVAFYPVVPSSKDLAVEPEIKKDTKLYKAKKGRYYLISGSFTSIENAKILQNELILKAYPAVIIKNKKLYSVAINQFAKRAEADQFKKKVIATNSKAFCWILKK